MNMDVPQPKRGPRNEAIKNSALLDIGKNMHSLTGDQSLFYKDQYGDRLKLYSQYIYKESDEMNKEMISSSNTDEQIDAEIKYINEDLEIATVRTRDFKSGRKVGLDKECQSDINIAPQIRKVRDTTEEIRDTIATVS